LLAQLGVAFPNSLAQLLDFPAASGVLLAQLGVAFPNSLA
jgi:hypothetical protein